MLDIRLVIGMMITFVIGIYIKVSQIQNEIEKHKKSFQLPCGVGGK